MDTLLGMETRTEITIDGHRWRVAVTWRGTRWDRPAANSITLTAVGNVSEGRGEVTSSLLRQVPVGRLLAELRPQPDVVPSPPEGQQAGRPPKYSPEHYRAVAEIYRAAVRSGSNPVESVAEHFETSLQVARRWVHVARNRHGLLPAVRRGQAG